MKLILVYNAEAGLLAGIMDSAHKALSPDTYSCSLCAVTHGPLRMDPRWRDYLRTLAFDAIFYHRPDFREAYSDYCGVELPLIALERGDTLEPLLDAAALQRIASVDQLIEALQAKLRNSASPSP